MMFYQLHFFYSVVDKIFVNEVLEKMQKEFNSVYTTFNFSKVHFNNILPPNLCIFQIKLFVFLFPCVLHVPHTSSSFTYNIM
jgi:hypothetical protein